MRRTARVDVYAVAGACSPARPAPRLLKLSDRYDLPTTWLSEHTANSHGFVSPHDIERLWRDQFDRVYRRSTATWTTACSR
jgi:hypothetical protein